MPKFEIIASNRYSDTYIVTAKDENEAREAVYNEDEYPDVEIDHVGTDCVGSDILKCELVEEEENA